MAYSTDEVKELKTKIDGALNGGGLNAWQIQFLADMRSRLDKYGTKTLLSDKQERKLHEIIDTRRRNDSFTRSRPIRAPRPFKVRPIGIPRPFQGRRKSYAPMGQSRIVFMLGLVALGVIFLLTQNSLVPTESAYLSTAPQSNAAVPITNRHFTVTDGDTIQLSGEARGLRLVGFNAPETLSPRCAQELELGNRAKARLKQIVAAGSLTLKRVPCSCASGTEGTDACNYGRSCGVLLAHGRDVSQTLISEGLAVRFVCGATSCPPLPRPWCT